MKKIIILAIVAVFTLKGGLAGGLLSAQGKQEFSPEQFQKNMERAVKQAAGLTDAEAEKFFPLLSKMMQEQRDVKKQQMQLMGQGKNAKSEADFKDLVLRSRVLEVTNAQIELTYYKKFHNVLSWEKIHKVSIALKRFQMDALKMFTPRMPGRPGGPGMPGRPGAPGRPGPAPSARK